MKTVLDLISGHAAAHGKRPAYRTPARLWTYADLWDVSGRAATGLAQRGIGRGDRLACLTKHTAECVALVLAACRLGAVCMPVNWRLAPAEIDYIVKDGRARFMMADEAFAQATSVTLATEGFVDWARGFTPLSEDARCAPARACSTRTSTRRRRSRRSPSTASRTLSSCRR